MPESTAVRRIEGRGRAVFALRDLSAGETILSELPSLLTVTTEALMDCCCVCLRRLAEPGFNLCSATRQGCFCTAECAQLAESTPGALSLGLRRALGSTGSLCEDEQNQLRFVLQALGLQDASLSSPAPLAAWQGLHELSVVGPPDQASAVRIHAAACEASQQPLSFDLIAQLLSKEAANSYGILAPSAADGERRVRGSAVYNQAACFNHECAPNAARLDDFDADLPLSERTQIQVVMLHDLPAGEEVVMSYFPLHWDLLERQERCQTLFGFVCMCPRCLIFCRVLGVQQLRRVELWFLPRHSDAYLAVEGRAQANVDSVRVQCESAQVLEEDAASEEEEGKVAQAVLEQARSSGSAREAMDPAYTQLFLLNKARTEAQFIAELEAELA